MTDPADDLTADAIRARTIDSACDRCGQMPDQTCYLPARRCPRPEIDEKEGDA